MNVNSILTLQKILSQGIQIKKKNKIQLQIMEIGVSEQDAV